MGLPHRLRETLFGKGVLGLDRLSSFHAIL